MFQWPTFPACRSWPCVVVVVTLMVTSACRTAPSTGGGYALNGVILEVDAARSELTVGHDAIQGLMPAMAMPFHVKTMPAAVSVGDRIAATLVVTADASWLENVRITPHAPSAISSAARDAPATTDAAGVVVPDVSLINQDGRSLRLADYRGKIVVLTFIYTRCPLPDYCPLTMRHLEEVRRTLGLAASGVRFVAVSFDPAHDTPDVLKAYGRRFIDDPVPIGQWDFVTGDPVRIADLAGHFGVTYVEQDGQISHSLCTAVLDADGRVSGIWRDNAWRVDDVVLRVRQLTAPHETEKESS